MDFCSRASSDGVLDRSFDLLGVPGVLWSPEDAASVLSGVEGSAEP